MVRNKISGLRENGRWLEDQTKVKRKVRDFFMARFNVGDRPQVRLDNAVFNSISNEDNDMLMEKITKDEVSNAMWNCDNLKSLGPNDFNFGFIMFCWEEIKVDVMRAVNNFEECGRWPRRTNASFISLIPKVDNPQLLNNFISISLVGCL